MLGRVRALPDLFQQPPLLIDQALEVAEPAEERTPASGRVRRRIGRFGSTVVAMLKVILILAALGSLGWFGYQELDLSGTPRPTTPSVGYPTVDADGGTKSVGEGTKGVLGN